MTEPSDSEALERLLRGYLPNFRWFGGKGRAIASLKISETVPIAEGRCRAQILFIDVKYRGGGSEVYLLPWAFATGHAARRVLEQHPRTVVLRVYRNEKDYMGLLHDAVVDRHFLRFLLEAILRRRVVNGVSGGMIVASPIGRLPSRLGTLRPTPLIAEQSNSAATYGRRFFLKLYRKLAPGENPELEIGRFLARKRFAGVPRLRGAIEYRPRAGEPMTLAVLQDLVPKSADGWTSAVEAAGRAFRRALERAAIRNPSPKEVLGDFFSAVKLLGRRTAELHRALASEKRTEKRIRAFGPERFTPAARRGLFESWRALTRRVFALLARRSKDLRADLQDSARRLRAMEGQVLRRFRKVLDRPLASPRIRCHGDFHLGQTLFTRRDVFITDFEGEPARPLAERREKHSALKDVAGMIRSFDYAAVVALGRLDSKVVERRDLWAIADAWQRAAANEFRGSYEKRAKGSAFLPESREEIEFLLDLYLLEKAIYELGYEIENRPAWAGIPLRALLEILSRS